MNTCFLCSQPLVIAASRGRRWRRYHEDSALDGHHGADVDDPGAEHIAVLARRTSLVAAVLSTGCHAVVLDFLLAQLQASITTVTSQPARSPLVLAVEQPLPDWMARVLAESLAGPAPETVPAEWSEHGTE